MKSLQCASCGKSVRCAQRSKGKKLSLGRARPKRATAAQCNPATASAHSTACAPERPSLSHAREVALDLKARLDAAIAEESYLEAAALRDELAGLCASRLSLLEELEMHHVFQLRNGEIWQKQQSLRALGSMNPALDVQRDMAVCLQHKDLVSPASKALEAVWSRHPSIIAINELMDEALHHVCRDQASCAAFDSGLQRAQNIYERVVDMDPEFGEGWNKLATVHYLAKNYEDSIEHCDAVLAINPLHYHALSGKGLCHSQLNQKQEAIECLRQALIVHPFLTYVKHHLTALESGV